MIQSENGYFEGVNTSAESSRRVYEKRGKSATLLFHLVE
jgi:hypothetical protein